MTQHLPNPSRKPKELTGRAALFCFLGFFGVVIAVNAVMIRAATTTFGGVETASSYKAGLAFKQEIAAARAQGRATGPWRPTCFACRLTPPCCP
ncbi:MAG: hypothetical protein GEU91_22410 [Rhizobiales bacterium]|nr:hypothetical protein [Hyphomicrobiales bacterium]